jgi:outer membrane lipoprotein-sorting protein
MYFRAAIYVLLLLCVSGFSSSSPDPKAVDILTASEQRFASLSDFSSRFRYTIDYAGQRSAIPPMMGTIRYRQGMYVIITPDQAIYCNLATHWFVDKVNEDVIQLPYQSSDDVAQEILFPIYRNKTRASFMGVELVETWTCDKVQVDIGESSVSYSKALVWVDRQTKLIRKIALIDRKQTTTSYVFFELKTNQGFTQEDFTFAGLIEGE